MKILINGFGRIGRAITRLLISQNIASDIIINDIINNKDLLLYLLENDSLYGKIEKKIDRKNLKISNTYLRFISNCNLIEELKKLHTPLDFIIDCSSVNHKEHKNILNNYNVKKIVVTKIDPFADFTYVLGVSEKEYNKKNHNYISLSVCDSMAIAPVLKYINDSYEISSGNIVTIHPWLTYQNLLDHTSLDLYNTSDYSIYRAAINNQIPRSTSAIKECLRIIPVLEGKIGGFNIRIPTNTVTSAIINLTTNKKINKEQLSNNLLNWTNKIDYIKCNNEPLVSTDFSKSNLSCIIDLRFLEVLPKNLLSIFIWYDNEWGYSNNVVRFIAKHES